jgi:hypothetical protein
MSFDRWMLFGGDMDEQRCENEDLYNVQLKGGKDENWHGE